MSSGDPWRDIPNKPQEETKKPASDWADAEFATESSRGTKNRAPRGKGKPKPKVESSKEDERKEEAKADTPSKPRSKTPKRQPAPSSGQGEAPNTSQPREPRHEADEESKRTGGQRSRGGFRGRRGRGGRQRPPASGELATVKKRRSNRSQITNLHPDEVIYRETDDNLDPNSEGTSFLRATETWEDLGLKQELIDALYEVGYDFPSKIQRVTLKMLQSMSDLQKLVAQSHTGSGKTAAFALASLLKVDAAVKAPQVLILAHTIELAQQISNEFKKFSVCLGIEVTTMTRSQTYRQGDQVIIGTDGAIKRMITSGTLDLTQLRVVVLDEADHMLNTDEKPEFSNDFKQWMERRFPPSTIYLLFSATFNATIVAKIEDLLEDHYEIKIKKEDLVLSNIKQLYYQMRPDEDKIEVADQLLKTVAKGLTIMFCNTCKFAELLFKRFTEKGHMCALLIGQKMSLTERERTMADFMELKYTLLITTNLLARGIDNKLVKNIINFDMPIDHKTQDTNYELYIHRIGRCGRFGRNGISITIAETQEEYSRVVGIGEHYNCTIEQVRDFEHLDQIHQEREED